MIQTSTALRSDTASFRISVFGLKGVLDTSSPVKIFWMKFGTPYVNGQPFIWSQSQWKSQKLRFVPDDVDGPWTHLNGYIR